MKVYYNIYLTINDVRVWMNKYTSKMSFTFAENLCSTAWKSAVDTASCKLVFNDRNVVELSDIVSKIVEAQQSFPQKEIQFEALNADESKTIFKGSLDLGKLSIESSKIPGSISITAKSPIDKLDKKPKANFVLYPATIKDVVERCVAEAGLGLIVEWKASISGKQLEVPFVVTDEDSDTWRDKIDTLLMEMGGCTLSFDHNGNKFYISKVNDESKAFSDIPVNYHVQSKLKSTTTKFAKDGVVVSYGNLKISKDQIVYYHDTNLKDKDSFLKGDEIAPGVYYPFDSDITKTFEEYQASNLDYGTLIGNTRKANNHINLFYVDPASTKVTIIASDMNGKGISDWYSNETFISKEGGFTYPGGGAFYPRKAWLSFKNNTENSVNITQFSISGDTYYSDAEYRIVMPLDCEDPEEYSAKYIADTETAKTLASFLMNQKRFGSDTSTWTERWENHSLGDKVKIQHKSGNIINAVIVKKESIIYGDELWAKITAVSLDGWSYEQPALVQNNVQSPSILDPYDNAVRNGYVGSREQWESRNDIFYLWSSSETELKPKKRAFWKLGGKWMLFANLPVGDFGMQDWMKSWAEVMADRTEEYNYLWAKVGLDGEPFLLQGVKGEDGKDALVFSIKTKETTIIKDMRSQMSQTMTFSIDKSGYRGETLVFSSVGIIRENTITFDRKQDAITISAFSIVPANGTVFSSEKAYFTKNEDGIWVGVIATKDDYQTYMVEEVRDIVTLSCVDVTGQPIYLGVYETEANLPSSYMESQNLIDGDYAIVDKPDGETPKITLYEYSTLSGWYVSSSPEKKASTVEIAVERAKNYIGDGIDYSDVIYSHEAYIVNLSAAVINASKINTGDIESFGFSEDENGNPISGYKLEYKGGNDGKGIIKAVGVKAKNSTFTSSVVERDCQIYGTLINQDEDGNVVLKTEQNNMSVSTMSSTRTDGSSTPSAYKWSSYYKILRDRVSGRTANTIYSCTANINGTAYKGYCNKTNITDPPSATEANYHYYSSTQTVEFPFNWTQKESFLYNGSGNDRVTVKIKIPDNYPTVTIRSIHISSNQYSTGTMWWTENHSDWYKLTIGTREITYFAGKNSGEGWNPSETVKSEDFSNLVAYPGEMIIAEFGGKYGARMASFIISLYESDTWSTGLKLIKSDGGLVDFSSAVPSSGWGTSAQTFTDDGVNYNIVMTASSSWPVTKYYSFQWDSAPSSSTNKTTSFIADGSSMSYNGTNLNYSQIGSATFSINGITIVSNSGNSYQFSVGGYYTQYSVSLTTQDSLLGIYAKNLMPVDTSSRIGGSDSAHLWQSIYCNTIYSNNSAPVSKRNLKENIKEWNGNALSLLNKVDIVEYNYISDPEKTYHIGFIADDTDERIAGEKHDRMDTTNCIGVLIKAIQELSEIIKQLENRSIT